jgi:FkbM family methyltransferase
MTNEPASPDPALPDAALPRIFSLVPGAAPVALHAYYPRFADYYPEAELQTKRWFVRNARPDWVFADIGANVGLYSMLFARLAPEGHVHAFEPTGTAALLRANLAAAEATNVTVHEVALGAAEGAREEAIYRIWGAAPETRAYPFVTLDGFVREAGLSRLDCVKIDVDGFDLEVLKGAREALARFDPWLVIELNHALATRGQSVGEALLWLLGQGYTEALVLDQENFVLKRAGAAPRGESLALRFDREPILLPPAFAAETPLPGLFEPAPVLHNDARSEGDTLVLPGPRWSYAASFPLAEAPPEGPLLVEAEVEVLAGAVGLGGLTADMGAFLGKEVMLSAAPGVQTARLLVPEAGGLGHLVLRNVADDGAEGRASLRALRAATARPATPRLSRVLEHGVRSFALDQVLDPGAPARPGREIAILPLEEMGAALGFAAPYVPEGILHRHGLEDFKTEIDEPGIYRYLYRQLRPRRHLEFGTWEGFGTVLCAQSCDAEIWTVNLPEGERDAAGAPLYAAQRLPGETSAPGADAAGDAGERIGWRYRAAGYGPRVHQLLIDSRDFPVGDFGPGFFDTVLVDGGHTPEVVRADTELALHLVRPGGAIIWHDFCPDPAALAASEAGRGVMRAWVEHHDHWRGRLAALHWLRPSWLLLGIRN